LTGRRSALTSFPVPVKVSGALAELVDLYPTLAEAAGVPTGTGEGYAWLNGTSLVPILTGAKKQVKAAALSQFLLPLTRSPP